MLDPYTRFGGKAWESLREEQKEYVQHLMLSWKGCYGRDWYYREMLGRAIKKARNNLP